MPPSTRAASIAVARGKAVNATQGRRYSNVSEVPFYRRRWFFAPLYFFFVPAAIVLLITGDIYYKKRDQVKHFGAAIRIVAAIFGLAWMAMVVGTVVTIAGVWNQIGSPTQQVASNQQSADQTSGNAIARSSAAAAVAGQTATTTPSNTASSTSVPASDDVSVVLGSSVDAQGNVKYGTDALAANSTVFATLTYNGRDPGSVTAILANAAGQTLGSKTWQLQGPRKWTMTIAPPLRDGNYRLTTSINGREISSVSFTTSGLWLNAGMKALEVDLRSGPSLLLFGDCSASVSPAAYAGNPKYQNMHWVAMNGGVSVFRGMDADATGSEVIGFAWGEGVSERDEDVVAPNNHCFK